MISLNRWLKPKSSDASTAPKTIANPKTATVKRILSLLEGHVTNFISRQLFLKYLGKIILPKKLRILPIILKVLYLPKNETICLNGLKIGRVILFNLGGLIDLCFLLVLAAFSRIVTAGLSCLFFFLGVLLSSVITLFPEHMVKLKNPTIY
jgi:hypothetical protein